MAKRQHPVGADRHSTVGTAQRTRKPTLTGVAAKFGKNLKNIHWINGARKLDRRTKLTWVWGPKPVVPAAEKAEVREL